VKSRTSVVAAAVALAVLSGGLAAQAGGSPETEMPGSPDICMSHHPEWSGAEQDGMHEAMAAGDVGAMASMMGAAMGPMASMMGGSMGHVGLGR
jgi:hypothetical protein